MILKVFAVHDKAVGAFTPPFFARSKGEAFRSFSSAVNTKDHQFGLHAGDYVLYELGEWDDGPALFKTGEPQRVVSALEVLEPDPFPVEKQVS